LPDRRGILGVPMGTTPRVSTYRPRRLRAGRGMLKSGFVAGPAALSRRTACSITCSKSSSAFPAAAAGL